MVCPYCGKEMQLGYLQSRDRIVWARKKWLIPSLSFLGKGSTSLKNGARKEPSIVYAIKCDDYKKDIIDCSGQDG